MFYPAKYPALIARTMAWHVVECFVAGRHRHTRIHPHDYTPDYTSPDCACGEYSGEYIQIFHLIILPIEKLLFTLHK